MRDVASDPTAEAVVKTILNLGNDLGLDCIAVGVETQQQLDYLQKQACAEIQGFLYSPAVMGVDCGALLRSGKAGQSDSNHPSRSQDEDTAFAGTAGPR
jgi:EAL domain-containing protein (putative c-di-GMP-specific phosphodiesterase class I)